MFKQEDLLPTFYNIIKSSYNFWEEIFYFNKIISTQKYIKENLLKNPKNIIVLASKQTKGVGRLNRHWFSPIGGLWFSMLINEEKLKYNFNGISLFCSLVCAKTLEKICNTKFFVKWPNDLILNKKKVAGILVERILKNKKIITGIGINVNNSLPSTLPDATTLKAEFIKEFDILSIFYKFVLLFYNDFLIFCKKGFSHFKDEYIKKMFLINEDVKIKTDNTIFQGKMLGVDKNGQLIFLYKNRKIKISSGSIEADKILFL